MSFGNLTLIPVSLSKEVFDVTFDAEEISTTTGNPKTQAIKLIILLYHQVICATDTPALSLNQCILGP